MSQHVVHGAPRTSSAPTLADVGTVLLGAAVGAAGGLLAGGIVFGSLVVALFGAMGGAVAGMIGALRHIEAPSASDDSLE